MLAMAIPFMLLYEFSVQASRVMQKRKRKKEEAEVLDEDADAGETA
jgi:Sec-independent protein secretion pathway component TatC